jgi:hypothetical protein
MCLQPYETLFKEAPINYILFLLTCREGVIHLALHSEKAPKKSDPSILSEPCPPTSNGTVSKKDATTFEKVIGE